MFRTVNGVPCELVNTIYTSHYVTSVDTRTVKHNLSLVHVEFLSPGVISKSINSAFVSDIQ